MREVDALDLVQVGSRALHVEMPIGAVMGVRTKMTAEHVVKQFPRSVTVDQRSLAS